MKLVFGLVLFLLAQSDKAQQLSGLDQDPVFNYVMARRVKYPSTAFRAGVYTRTKIYTHFSLDSLGHVQDIMTLNPSGTDYGFEQQIYQALKHLPPLKPAYAGDYIIPAIFVFTYRKDEFINSQGIGKIDAIGLTNDELLTAYPGQTILKELQVKTYAPASYRPPRVF